MKEVGVFLILFFVILVSLNHSSNVENFSQIFLKSVVKNSAGVIYECNDGFDNDGDGYVDWPLDPGCDDSFDDDELPQDYGGVECNDGIDNDGDGSTDLSDPDCNGDSFGITESTLIWDNYNDTDKYDKSINQGIPSVKNSGLFLGDERIAYDDFILRNCSRIRKISWIGAKSSYDDIDSVEFDFYNAIYNESACNEESGWTGGFPCGWNSLYFFNGSLTSYEKFFWGDTVYYYPDSDDYLIHEGLISTDMILPAGKYFLDVDVNDYIDGDYLIMFSGDGKKGLDEFYWYSSSYMHIPRPYSLSSPPNYQYSYDLAFRLYGNLPEQTIAECRVCGDGVVQEGEECDIGGVCDDNGAFCTLGYLSNCEDPSSAECLIVGDSHCSSDCHLISSCGDGVVQEGEECDDGNSVGGDGCSASCELECGDGIVDSDGSDGYSEECDGSNLNGETCVSYRGDIFKGGDLSCNNDCTFDVSGCVQKGVCEVDCSQQYSCAGGMCDVLVCEDYNNIDEVCGLDLGLQEFKRTACESDCAGVSSELEGHCSWVGGACIYVDDNSCYYHFINESDCMNGMREICYNITTENNQINGVCIGESCSINPCESVSLPFVSLKNLIFAIGLILVIYLFENGWMGNFFKEKQQK